MTPYRLFKLTADSLRRDISSAVLSCFGTAVGIASLVFFVALGAGVRETVQNRLFPTDVSAVEVIPSAVSLGSIFGGGKLDESAFQRLSSVDGVVRAYRKMEVRVPAMAVPTPALADTFRVPKNIRVALIAVGVERDFVDPEGKSPFSLPKSSAAGNAPGSPSSLPWETLPAMASDRLLTLYNQAFAKSQGLPGVSKAMLESAQGVPLVAVQLGRSMTGGRRLEDGFVTLSFAGLSSRAPVHGVLIPLEAAKSINAAYGLDDKTYSAVTLIAKNPAAASSVRKAVSDMGFSVDDGDRSLAEKIGQAIALTTAAMALLSVLICLIAAINIAHALLSSTRLRAREFALMRAVGAAKSDVALLILSEAGIIGLAGGAAGMAAAKLASIILQGFMSDQIPQFTLSAAELFSFSPALMASALGIALASALAGAAIPAVLAARACPAKILAG